MHVLSCFLRLGLCPQYGQSFQQQQQQQQQPYNHGTPNGLGYGSKGSQLPNGQQQQQQGASYMNAYGNGGGAGGMQVCVCVCVYSCVSGQLPSREGRMAGDAMSAPAPPPPTKCAAPPPSLHYH